MKDKNIDIEKEDSVDELKIINENKHKGFRRESSNIASVKRQEPNLDKIKAKEFNCNEWVLVPPININ